MTDNQKQSGQEEQAILNVSIPEKIMQKVELFCSDNHISLEQFVEEALAEKMTRWKE